LHMRAAAADFCEIVEKNKDRFDCWISIFWNRKYSNNAALCASSQCCLHFQVWELNIHRNKLHWAGLFEDTLGSFQTLTHHLKGYKNYLEAFAVHIKYNTKMTYK
jgi:hypothetical protein